MRSGWAWLNRSTSLALLPVAIVGLAGVAQRARMAASFGIDAARAAPVVLGGVALELTPVALAYTLAFFAPRAIFRRLAAAVFALQALVIAGDWAHFEMTSLRLDGTLLANLRVEAIRAFLGISALPWLLAAVGLAVLFYRLGVRAATVGARPGVAALVLAGALLVGLVESPPARHDDGWEAAWVRDRQQRMIAASSWGNLAFHLVGYWRSWEGAQEPALDDGLQPPSFSAAELSELASLGLLAPAAGDGGGAERAAFSRIVMVVAESLALELIPPYGHVPRHVMPYTSELVERHPSLSAYWSTNTPTDPGLWAMFRSRPAFDPEAVDGDTPSLFAALEAAGWRTIFARSYWAQLWGHAERYPKWFGIRRLLGTEALLARRPAGEPPPRLWRWGMNDCDLLSAGADMLAAEDPTRLFLVLKTNDTHYPYGGIVGPEALAAGPLARSLLSLDTCFKRFVRHLVAVGFFDDRSLLVLTADHSPNHGAHRRLTGAPDYRPGRIPLLLIAGERAPRIAIDRERLASQIDLAPTLLELAGVPVPAGFWGRSLVGSAPRDLAITYEAGDLLFRTRGGTTVVPFAGDARAGGASDDRRRRALAKWVLARRMGLALPPAPGRVGSSTWRKPF